MAQKTGFSTIRLAAEDQAIPAKDTAKNRTNRTGADVLQETSILAIDEAVRKAANLASMTEERALGREVTHTGPTEGVLVPDCKDLIPMANTWADVTRPWPTFRDIPVDQAVALTAWKEPEQTLTILTRAEEKTATLAAHLSRTDLTTENGAAVMASMPPTPIATLETMEIAVATLGDADTPPELTTTLSI